MMDTTRPAGVNTSPPPLRVLLLEDNPRDAKLTASILEREGYRVQFEVTDSAEFFRERLEKAEYDVILADFNLGSWNALDALEILKRSGKDVPLIVVTGSLGDEDAVECIKLGAADFVLKDRPARLPTAVQRALEETSLHTENKRAFEAISRLATIVDSSDDAIVGATLEGVITNWNNGAEKLYGYSAAEVLGQPVSVLAPPDRSEEGAQMLATLRHGTLTEHSETVRVRKDGSLVNVSLSVFPLTDSRGEVTGAASIARDITDRKRAEDELLFKTALLEAQSETTLDGILVVDLTGQILLANRQFARMLNIPEEAIRTKKDKKLIEHALTQLKDPDAFLERVNYLYAHETEKSRDEIEFKDGRVFDRYSSPLQDSSGKLHGRIWYFRDITERKRTEEALREAAKRARIVAESVTDVIYEWDLKDKVEWYGDVDRLMGYPTGGFPRTLDGWVAALHPEDKERVWLAVESQLKGAVPFNVEYRIAEKGGGWRWWSAHGTVLRDEQGQPRRWIGAVSDITGRKRAEEALIEERHLLCTLMDNLPAMIYFKDRESHFTRINQAHAKLFGLSDPAQAVGKSDFDFFTAEHAQEAYRDEQEIIRTGQPLVDREEKETWSDGRVTWASTTKMPLRDANGNIIGTFGVSHDITESKWGEEVLYQSRQMLQSILDTIPQRVLWKDRNSVYLGCNKAFAIDAGLKDPAEIIGKNDYELAWREMAEVYRADDKLVMEQETPRLKYEEIQNRPDGSLIWLRTSKLPLHDQEGKVIGMIGTYDDITESKQAEAKHTRLVTAIEQSAEGVVITDAGGNIEYVNPAFTRITGYSREEALGQNPRILKSGKQDLAFYQQLWATILKGDIWHGEVTNRRKDGSFYIEEMGIAPVRSTRGEVTHYIATKKDVTERKSMEAQLRQAAKMEAIGRLAGGVAHDFNNLLTIISGYGQLLQERLSPQDLGHVEEILKASDRAAALTRQLLAFSRRQILAPQVLDLNSVVADLEKMLRRLIGEDIDLTTLQQSGLGRVKADPGQIEQVIINLAVNARDAMPQGGKLTIETANVDLDETYALTHTGVTPGPHVMLAVADTGIGMDAEILGHIFEPFFTTKERGKGTGLGLATLYGIVKQSAGSVWVYSEPGQGTTFKIFLPRVEESGPEARPAMAPSELAKGSETVLVVEDEEGVRSLVCQTLTSHGYKVLEAAGAAQALTIAEQHTEPIHLLLTDVVMPQTGGRELAKRLSTLLHPETKVLYMSGYTDDAIVRHGVLEADTFFLQKPFGPSTLLRKVREVLDVKPGGQR